MYNAVIILRYYTVCTIHKYNCNVQSKTERTFDKCASSALLLICVPSRIMYKHSEIFRDAVSLNSFTILNDKRAAQPL